MRYLFWTAVKWIGSFGGELSLRLYWAGKDGQRRTRGSV